ncbi:PhnA domain-containing protein [Ferrimonas lipolytica]|uniref:PhnA domain protein n=1 Tax=Ferrimonas lipolytica TaxID=2724191 RepID=A0A6H1UB83_9GAMM|nr:alkylphosphonate utilization protein [Ferrimonas lipolytica]QIZ76098.1 PhnA domain protein [Ferrimonas lipolytica]
MALLKALNERAGSKCELCAAENDLSVYDVPPSDGADSDKAVLVCATCASQIEDTDNMDSNHWRCLNDSMWSQVPAVQVMSFRQLKMLVKNGESWAQDLLDMIYLEEQTQAWADLVVATVEAQQGEACYDELGVKLNGGDNVYLIKDLDVKGSSMVAKRGTTVRNISLTNNPEHIEGRVNGQRIVIISKYVRKS